MSNRLLARLSFVLAETCTWYYLALKGTVFPPRFKHTSSLLKTGLHVFGGTGSGTLFNDVYVLEKLTEDLFAGPVSPRVPPAAAAAAAEKGRALSDANEHPLGTSLREGVARYSDVQVELLRQSLQHEKEAREKLEVRLASKEGDYLIAMEATKRLESDLAKVCLQMMCAVRESLCS